MTVHYTAICRGGPLDGEQFTLTTRGNKASDRFNHESLATKERGSYTLRGHPAEWIWGPEIIERPNPVDIPPPARAGGTGTGTQAGNRGTVPQARESRNPRNH